VIYYALIKGSGEGCDYTIGCNIQWMRIEADDDAAAIRAAIDDIRHSIDSELDIESIKLLAVIREIDMAAALEDARREKKKEEADQRRARTLAEIERLKKEIGE
jgi:hypothetical protein